MDMERPDGLLGPLVLTGRARDMRTGLDGVAAVLATSECTARVDFTGGRVLAEISTTPGRPALQALLGRPVSSGFRSALTAADPRLSAEDGLLNLLLDDFPVTTLVSGHAIGAGLARQGRTVLSLSLAEATGQPRAEAPAVPPGPVRRIRRRGHHHERRRRDRPSATGDRAAGTAAGYRRSPRLARDRP